MQTESDLYGVLGVSPASDDVVIRAAFKALMLKYHPDTNRSEDATRRAAEINAAFAILGDPAKRANYDKRRAGGSTDGARCGRRPQPEQSDSRRPGQPRATPKPPRSKAPVSAPRSSGWRRAAGWAASILVIILIKVVVTAAAHGGSSPMAVENAGDNAAAVLGDNMLVPADEPTSASPSGNLMQNATASPITTPHPLGPQPATALAYDDIEGAARNFDRILQKSGMTGARAFSETCHKGVVADPSWAAADRCAAFDYSASFIDEGVTKSMNATPDGYFTFQKDNQADNYQPVGGSPYLVGQRLQAIQKAANSAVYDAISARIARSQTRDTRQSSSTAAGDPTAAPITNSM